MDTTENNNTSSKRKFNEKDDDRVRIKRLKDDVISELKSTQKDMHVENVDSIDGVLDSILEFANNTFADTDDEQEHSDEKQAEESYLQNISKKEHADIMHYIICKFKHVECLLADLLDEENHVAAHQKSQSILIPHFQSIRTHLENELAKIYVRFTFCLEFWSLIISVNL